MGYNRNSAKALQAFAARHLKMYRTEGLPAFKRLVAIREGVIKVGEPMPFQYDIPERYLEALAIIDKLWR